MKPNQSDLNWLLKLIDVGEEDLINAVLSTFSPYQPGSLLQKLKRRQKEELGRDPYVVPSTSDLWS